MNAPPSPRILSLEHVRDLPGAPGDLTSFPADTLAELVVLGLNGDPDRPTAHVAVYLEDATNAASWVTMIEYTSFLEAMPSWAVLNVPHSPTELDAGPPRMPVPHRRHRRARQPGGNGAELSAAWQTRRRPVRTTERYLLEALEHVPDDMAVDYLTALRHLRRRSFGREERQLIADVCAAVAMAVVAAPGDD